MTASPDHGDGLDLANRIMSPDGRAALERSVAEDRKKLADKAPKEEAAGPVEAGEGLRATGAAGGGRDPPHAAAASSRSRSGARAIGRSMARCLSSSLMSVSVGPG